MARITAFEQRTRPYEDWCERHRSVYVSELGATTNPGPRIDGS